MKKKKKSKLLLNAEITNIPMKTKTDVSAVTTLVELVTEINLMNVTLVTKEKTENMIPKKEPVTVNSNSEK